MNMNKNPHWRGNRLKEISENELDASVNKIVDACINDLELGEKIVIYKKENNEINVARSVIIRESMYKKLEEMREKYGISISKLINIAIRIGLEKYDKRKAKWSNLLEIFQIFDTFSESNFEQILKIYET